MPLRFKIDVLAALKAAGYSSYKLRKDRILGEATIQRLREGGPVTWHNVELICQLLSCQPGDILEYDEKPEE